MAVLSIAITQDNIYNDSRVMPVHSPLVFLVDATHNGVPPTSLYVDILQDDVLKQTYKLIYLSDLSNEVRRFAFVADGVVRPLLKPYTETYQLNGSVLKLDNIIENFALRFRSDDGVASSDSVYCDFTHGTAQFSELPNLVDIRNNEDEVIFCPKDFYCYVYFYNDDKNKVITVQHG